MSKRLVLAVFLAVFGIFILGNLLPFLVDQCDCGFRGKTFVIWDAYLRPFSLIGVVPQSCGDARRVADIKYIGLALALYQDARGEYPGSLDALVGESIPRLPKDPIAESGYFYQRVNDGYRLEAWLHCGDIYRIDSTP